MDLNPKPLDPDCPRCRGIVLRMAERDENANKEFRGCARFSMCRSVIMP